MSNNKLDKFMTDAVAELDPVIERDFESGTLGAVCIIAVDAKGETHKMVHFQSTISKEKAKELDINVSSFLETEATSASVLLRMAIAASNIFGRVEKRINEVMNNIKSPGSTGLE